MYPLRELKHRTLPETALTNPEVEPAYPWTLACFPSILDSGTLRELDRADANPGAICFDVEITGNAKSAVPCLEGRERLSELEREAPLHVDTCNRTWHPLNSVFTVKTIGNTTNLLMS